MVGVWHLAVGAVHPSLHIPALGRTDRMTALELSLSCMRPRLPEASHVFKFCASHLEESYEFVPFLCLSTLNHSVTLETRFNS